MAEVKISITAEDGVTRVFRAVEEGSKSAFSSIESGGKESASAVRDFGHACEVAKGRAMDFFKGLMGFEMVKTVIVSAKNAVADLADSFISVASSNEQYLVTLETLLGSQEAANQAFKELNEFARETPFQIDQIVRAFMMLKAMGLEPNIRTMRILGDTASALGGGYEKMEGIARALGQIVTKGRVSAEELTQLAEQLVPSYEILQEKLGLTAQQVENIGKAGIDARTAVEALLEGMEERYGGQMERMRDKWQGIVEEIKSLWRDFLTEISREGAFDSLKSMLRDVRDWMIDAFETGRVKQWAHDISEGVRHVIELLKGAVWWVNAFGESLYTVKWYLGFVKTEEYLLYKSSEAQAARTIERYRLMNQRVKEFGIEGINTIDELLAAEKRGEVAFDEFSGKWIEIKDNSTSAMKEMEKDLSLVYSESIANINSLDAWQEKYEELSKAADKAFSEIKKKQEEIARIESAQRSAKTKTEEMLFQISIKDLSPVEKLEARMQRLQEQLESAAKLSGQEQIRTLEQIQQKYWQIYNTQKQQGEDAVQVWLRQEEAAEKIKQIGEQINQLYEEQKQKKQEELEAAKQHFRELLDQIDELRDRYDDLFSEEKKVDVDVSEALQKIEELQEAWDNLNLEKIALIKIHGENSTIKPFSEKMKEIYELWQKYTFENDAIIHIKGEGSSIRPISEKLAEMQAGFASLPREQEYLINFIANAPTLGAAAMAADVFGGQMSISEAFLKMREIDSFIENRRALSIYNLGPDKELQYMLSLRQQLSDMVARAQNTTRVTTIHTSIGTVKIELPNVRGKMTEAEMEEVARQLYNKILDYQRRYI